MLVVAIKSSKNNKNKVTRNVYWICRAVIWVLRE